MKDLLIKEYKNTKILNLKSKQPSNTFNVNFVDGAFLEVVGPLEEKYTFSAIFEINEKTQVVNQWFGRTVIFSDQRFSYEETQHIIS